MSLIERWAIKICRDCGAQVHGGGLCRQHDPPGRPVETMVRRVSDFVVLDRQLAGAVEARRALREAQSRLHSYALSRGSTEGLVGVFEKLNVALDRLREQ